MSKGVALSPEIFRAYDVRGIVGKTLDSAVVCEIGRAIGSEAGERGQQSLVVGYDGRLSGPALAEALVRGLRSAGQEVIEIGQVPTPVLYFATWHLQTGSGVMVTGSHNPPDHNGLKIMLGGDTLFGDDIAALRERIETGRFSQGSGGLRSVNVTKDYIRRVCEEIPAVRSTDPRGSGLRIVVDCGNSVAGEVAPGLLRALGHEVVELFCEVDGHFPNHHPDPSDPDNLQDLIAAVGRHGADVGFAFDGDGDRLGVVDDEGAILWPDRQMMLFARDVLARNPGAQIVFDVKCTHLLPQVITELGGKPVMCKTGHSFIKTRLKETGAPLAGEMSGHIFFNDRWYGFDDALYAAARMAEILTGSGEKPSRIFARLPAAVSTPEIKVPVPEGEQGRFVARLLAAPNLPGGRVTTIDGLRVDFADGWGLVRASNTTACLVMRFEGTGEAALRRIQGEFKTLLHGLDARLPLPF